MMGNLSVPSLAKRSWAVFAAFLLCACGRETGPDFEVAGVYTELGDWEDGQFKSSFGLASILLSSDGSATRLSAGCPGGSVVTSELHWKLSGKTVVIYEDDTDDTFSRLVLASSRCGEHQYSPADSDDHTAYAAGRYCAVDVGDNGHLGSSCEDWEPCDDAARECVETFNRELNRE